MAHCSPRLTISSLMTRTPVDTSDQALRLLRDSQRGGDDELPGFPTWDLSVKQALTAAAYGNNHIALSWSGLTSINALTCQNDPY